jgi:hypothetical protein
MERIDRVKPETERLLRAQQQRREKPAVLPFPEKVRIVVQMQGWRRRCCAPAETGSRVEVRADAR